jgi:hypothetical protein
MTETFPKKSLPTIQAHDQSLRYHKLLSDSVAITTCHSLLLYTSHPKTAGSRIGLTQHKGKDASGGKLSREIIINEITILLTIFKSK